MAHHNDDGGRPPRLVVIPGVIADDPAPPVAVAPTAAQGPPTLWIPEVPGPPRSLEVPPPPTLGAGPDDEGQDHAEMAPAPTDPHPGEDGQGAGAGPLGAVLVAAAVAHGAAWLKAAYDRQQTLRDKVSTERLKAREGLALQRARTNARTGTGGPGNGSGGSRSSRSGRGLGLGSTGSSGGRSGGRTGGPGGTSSRSGPGGRRPGSTSAFGSTGAGSRGSGRSGNSRGSRSGGGAGGGSGRGRGSNSGGGGRHRGGGGITGAARDRIAGRVRTGSWDPPGGRRRHSPTISGAVRERIAGRVRTGSWDPPGGSAPKTARHTGDTIRSAVRGRVAGWVRTGYWGPEGAERPAPPGTDAWSARSAPGPARNRPAMPPYRPALGAWYHAGTGTGGWEPPPPPTGPPPPPGFARPRPGRGPVITVEQIYPPGTARRTAPRPRPGVRPRPVLLAGTRHRHQSRPVVEVVLTPPRPIMAGARTRTGGSMAVARWARRPAARQQGGSDLTIHGLVAAAADLANDVMSLADPARLAVIGCGQLIYRLEALYARAVDLEVPGSLPGDLLALIEQASLLRSEAKALSAAIPGAAEAIGRAGTNCATRHLGVSVATADNGLVQPAAAAYHDQ